MKLVTYSKKQASDTRLGAILNEGIVDLNTTSKGKLPSAMLAFIEAGESALKIAKEILTQSDLSVIPIQDVKLHAPLLNPPSLKDAFAFEDHAKQGSKRVGIDLSDFWYDIPVYYKGNHRQIFSPEDEIPWPSYTRKLDFECEIACVVGKKGTNLSVKEASNYIFGYMIFNDVSARDIQKKEMALRLGPAKSKDFANVFGPYLVTADEVDPRKDFSLKVRVNGEVWTEGHFNEQHWQFPCIISHISQSEYIYPGDIIGSGTFYKGCGLDLDKWIQPGDVIELEVNKLGVLKNKIGSPVSQVELNYREECSKN